MPTLVLHGDADRIVPFEASGKRTHELIEGSRLVVIKGGPHGLTWTHAAESTMPFWTSLKSCRRRGGLPPRRRRRRESTENMVMGFCDKRLWIWLTGITDRFPARSPDDPVQVLIIHGDADRIVPFSAPGKLTDESMAVGLLS